MRDVRVQFGDLDDFFGMPGRAEGFTFVPANVKLHGDTFVASHPLHEAVGASLPAILVEAIREKLEAAWVRGRLPRVFDFEPESPSDEASLLHATFLAVETDSPFAYPFHCTDSSGRIGLVFSPLGPEADVQARIAAAFWSVLLQKPADLAEFAARVFHPTSGEWRSLGVRDGLVFREVSS